LGSSKVLITRETGTGKRARVSNTKGHNKKQQTKTKYSKKQLKKNASPESPRKLQTESNVKK